MNRNGLVPYKLKRRKSWILFFLYIHGDRP
jgi:hypothetical protein